MRENDKLARRAICEDIFERLQACDTDADKADLKKEYDRRMDAWLDEVHGEGTVSKSRHVVSIEEAKKRFLGQRDTSGVDKLEHEVSVQNFIAAMRGQD